MAVGGCRHTASRVCFKEVCSVSAAGIQLTLGLLAQKHERLLHNRLLCAVCLALLAASPTGPLRRRQTLDAAQHAARLAACQQ